MCTVHCTVSPWLPEMYTVRCPVALWPVHTILVPGVLCTGAHCTGCGLFSVHCTQSRWNFTECSVFSVQSTGGYCKECGVFSVQRVVCLRYHTQAYSVQMYNIQMYRCTVYICTMYRCTVQRRCFPLAPWFFPSVRSKSNWFWSCKTDNPMFTALHDCKQNKAFFLRLLVIVIKKYLIFFSPTQLAKAVKLNQQIISFFSDTFKFIAVDFFAVQSRTTIAEVLCNTMRLCRTYCSLGEYRTV